MLLLIINDIFVILAHQHSNISDWTVYIRGTHNFRRVSNTYTTGMDDTYLGLPETLNKYMYLLDTIL